MALKRDATDAVFSEAVREAADWICQRCGKMFPDRKGQDIHASHYISRKFLSVRWHPDNCVCLCASCHGIVTDDPGEHYRLIYSILGEGRYDMLKQRKHQIVRYREAEKRDIRMHFRIEIDRIRAMRADGVIGRVELTPYD